jgi:hypothetical protein
MVFTIMRLTLIALFITAKVLGQTVPKPIPFLSPSTNVIFATDFRVGIIGADTVFIDISGNGRHIKITNCDFNIADPQRGWTYNSRATITAPAGDATFIAADTDSMFYEGGVAQAVNSRHLFQDINYSHKIFSRHTIRTVDVNGNQNYVPHVQCLVMYANAQSGNALTRCNEYYGVPVENTTTMAWISKRGSDATGNGSKINPYRSLNQVRNTTKTIVYSKCGDFDMGATSVTFGGAAPLVIQSTGRCSFWLSSTAAGCVIDNTVTFRNFTINDSSTNGMNNRFTGLTIDKCYINKTKGTNFSYINGAGTPETITDCIFNTMAGTSICLNIATPSTYTFNGNYGVIKHIWGAGHDAALLVLKYNKGVPGSGSTLYANSVSYRDNKGLVNLLIGQLTSKVRLTNEVIDFAINFSDTTTISNCTITGNVVGKYDSILNSNITGTSTITAKKNLLIDNCYFYQFATANANTLFVSAAANSNVTGVKITNTYIYGNVTTQYCLYVGETAQQSGVNALTSPYIFNNLIANLSTTTSGASAHTVFIGGTANPNFIFNQVEAPNGYFMVIKSGGVTYTSTDPHIHGNIFIAKGTLNKGIYVRGANGVVVSNNAFLNYQSSSNLFEEDDNALSQAHSLLCINNTISLAGSAGYGTGSALTTRKNGVAKNGFSCTVPASDSVITATFSSSGVPSVALDFGETTTRTTLLDPSYIIPTAPVYVSQSGNWQIGPIKK